MYTYIPMVLMYSASEWIFPDLWRYINVLLFLLIIINEAASFLNANEDVIVEWELHHELLDSWLSVN